MASGSPAIATAQVGQFTVTNNTGETSEQLKARLTPEGDVAAAEIEEKDPVSTAASELGKLGGKAAAKAKAKAAKEARKEAKVAEAAEVEAKAKEAAPAGEAEEAEAEPEEKPLGKPRDDPRARMLEATRKESEAKKALAALQDRYDRDIETLRNDIQALKSHPGRPEEAGEDRRAPEAPRELKKPTVEEFDDYEKYLDARDDYNRRMWTEENEKRTRHAQINQTLQSAHEKFKGAIEDVWETIKPTVGRLNPTFNLPPGSPETAGNWIANFLFFNPETARTLALHLHEHPDELQRLSTLTSPHAVSRELGKIEARIEAATTDISSEAEPEVSKAAPPVKPVSGAPYVAAGSDGYRKGMSLAEYARVWKPAKQR